MSEEESKEKPKEQSSTVFGQISPDMSSKEAYFQLLRTWVNQANMSQNALACFPYFLMANYPQLFQNQTQGSSPTNLAVPGQPNIGGIGANQRGDRRIADYFDNEARQEEIINQNGGYEFTIAPLWKRFAAEIIDVLILLILKVFLTFTVVDLFDLHLGFEFDIDALKKSIEDDYTEFLSFSSDLLVFEILTKVAVCFYEALWTTTGHFYVGGATPGKILMGIRIVHVEAVLPLQPIQPGLNLNNGANLRALLYPAANPGFKRALFRAILKNILMALLFPMCFIVLFFKNNRTGYDIMTKTIVVEENHAPILRRR